MLMRERYICREEARTSGDRNIWNLCRQKRNEVTRETRKEKKVYFKNFYYSPIRKNYTKQIFGTTRELLGWQKESGPRSFFWQGALWRRPVDL